MKKIMLTLLLFHTALVFPQNRNGVITSRILTADGKPAANVMVGVAPAPDAAPLVTAQTDADGRYRLENVPPGRYILIAGPADRPTYFGATVLTVATDSTVTPADFLLARAGNATVSGRVTPAPGPVAAALKAVRVAIVPSGYPPQTLETAVQADGTFEFSKVAPGPYITRVLPGNTSLQSNNPYPTHGIFVENEDIRGVELEGPVTVVARVLVEGGGKLPIPPAQSAIAAANPADALTSVRLEARNSAITSAQTLGQAAYFTTTAPVRANGTALLFVTPGEYRMSLAGLPAGGTTKSMLYGNIDLLRDPAKFGPSSSSEMVLTVSLPAVSGVTVRGRITGLPSSGLPSGVSVNTPGAGATPVSPDGTFEFHGIPAGDRDINLVRQGASYLSGQVASSSLARIRITIADKDVNNVELPWLPLAALSVQATLLDKAGNLMSGIPSGTSLLVSSRDGQPIAGGCDTTGCRRDIVTMNLSGSAPSYSFLLPPGEFDVKVDKLPAGYVVRALKSAGTDLLKSPLKIDKETTSSAFEIILQNTSGARVNGKVIGTGSAPLLPRAVTIRGTTGQAFTAQARVDDRGEFEFAGISPGAYTLQTNPDGSPLAWGSTTINILVNDRDVAGIPIAGLSENQNANSLQYANEAAVIQNLQAIQRAENNYNNAFRKVANLDELVAVGLLDARFGNVISGYTIRMTTAPSPTQPGGDLTLIASPTAASTGRYVFLGSQTRNFTFYYQKADGPPPAAAEIRHDARGQLMRADGRPFDSVSTCGGDVPVCLRFDPVLEVRTVETGGSVTFSADVASPRPAAVLSNVYVGFIASNGSGNFAGVRSDGSFRVVIPAGEVQFAIQNLPDGYSVKSATFGTTDLLRGPFNAGAGLIEVTLGLTNGK